MANYIQIYHGNKLNYTNTPICQKGGFDDKIVFIMFQGAASIVDSWNQGDGKFLDKLKKLGNVYTYQSKISNLYHYHYRKVRDHYKKFPKDIDFNLDYMDVERHIEMIYIDVNQKYPGGKFIPIGWSAGSLYAMAFVNIYKDKCVGCVLLDPVLITMKNIRLRLDDLKRTGGSDVVSDISEKKLQSLISNIKKNKINRDATLLIDRCYYKITKWWHDHLSLIMSVPTIDIKNLDVPEIKSNDDFNNVAKLNEIAEIKNVNQNNYVYRIFVNEGHSLFQNKIQSSDIVEMIKNMLKMIE